jgi:hypothetical protein
MTAKIEFVLAWITTPRIDEIVLFVPFKLNNPFVLTRLHSIFNNQMTKYNFLGAFFH